MNTGTKKHIGIVTRIEDSGSAIVKIYRNQCDGCKLGDICSISGDDELDITFGNVINDNLNVGDRVMIEELQRLEWIAIFLCVFLPCVLFLLAVIGLSEAVSVLCGCISGMIVLAVYYGLFYAVRNRIKFNKINFVIKKI